MSAYFLPISRTLICASSICTTLWWFWRRYLSGCHFILQIVLRRLGRELFPCFRFILHPFPILSFFLRRFTLILTQSFLKIFLQSLISSHSKHLSANSKLIGLISYLRQISWTAFLFCSFLACHEGSSFWRIRGSLSNSWTSATLWNVTLRLPLSGQLSWAGVIIVSRKGGHRVSWYHISCVEGA